MSKLEFRIPHKVIGVKMHVSIVSELHHLVTDWIVLGTNRMAYC